MLKKQVALVRQLRYLGYYVFGNAREALFLPCHQSPLIVNPLPFQHTDKSGRRQTNTVMPGTTQLSQFCTIHGEDGDNHGPLMIIQEKEEDLNTLLLSSPVHPPQTQGEMADKWQNTAGKCTTSQGKCTTCCYQGLGDE